MYWVLQTNIFNEAKYTELEETLGRFGIPYSQHKVIPFVGQLEPDFNPKDKNVICIGSYSMRHIAAERGWNPGVFDLFDKNFLVQKEHWGDKLLNYDSKVMPFKDVTFTDDYHFIRPIDDSKYFAGKVFDRYEFKEWQVKVCDLNSDYGNSLRPNTLVQVCNGKEIYREVRYWVVNGQIVTSSVYKVGDKVQYFPNIDPHMDQFAIEVIGEWQPDKAFVVDICETPNGFKIVEINTINSSGFYAADIQKLVYALQVEFSLSK